MSQAFRHNTLAITTEREYATLECVYSTGTVAKQRQFMVPTSPRPHDGAYATVTSRAMENRRGLTQ